MADSTDFGARLRSARTAMGMSLDEAGRRLRIEPAVLDAIESMDFANMPPKYMTRSMVNAYSQMVGLNPTAMTRDFLDAEYQYQMAKSGGGYYDNSQAGNSVSTRAAKGSGMPGGTYGSASGYGSTARGVRSTGSYGTTGTASRSSYSRLSSDSGRQRISYSETDDEEPARTVRRNPDGTVRRSRFTAFQDDDGAAYDEEPQVVINKAPAKDRSRLFMLVGCILAVVLIVVLIKVIFVSDAGTGIDPNSPVSGVIDPEAAGIQSSTGSDITRKPIKPTACFFSMQVDNSLDGTVYVEIYTYDGSISDFEQGIDLTEWDLRKMGWNVSYNNFEGGDRKQFDVTNMMYVYTNNPSAIALTLNGETVNWGLRTCGYGYYYLVDFPTYLEQWEDDHADELKDDK